MFRKLGLGAVFTFDNSQAEAAMAKSHRSFLRLSMDTERLKRGVHQVESGLRGLAIVGTGLAAGLGMGSRAGIAFEQQMANVQAVLMTTKKQLKALEEQAMTLGATTQFTATQVGQAQEILVSELKRAQPN